MLLKHRLDSDDAYSRFEVFHLQHADSFYYSRIRNATLSLLVIHHRDGKSVDPELVLRVIESDLSLRALFLVVAKQLALQGKWNDAQRQRLQELILEHLLVGRWDKSTKPFFRLARAITDKAFEDRVQLLLSYKGITGELAALVLGHIDQEHMMRAK
ncbi:MAG: hypothetical protein QM758_08645 [Armatimonas sp.]